MGFQVWSVPLQRRFIASRVSCGCCLVIMFWAVVLLVPFFLAYTSESFWLKTSDYLEYPRTEFKYQALLVATGKDSNGQPITMTFSTSPELRRGPLSTTVRPASLRTYSVDSNLDRSPEAIHINFELPLQAGEAVYGMSALIMFQMDLSNRVKVKLESAAYVDYSSAVPGASLYVDGDLMLMQNNALAVTGGYSEPYKTSPLLGNTTYSPSSMDEILLPVLLDRYRARNLTTIYKHQMTRWTPSSGVVESGTSPTTSLPPFKASFTVRIPQQKVMFVPTVSEMLKFAWIQYLAVAWIVYVLATYSADFVFSYQVVETSSRLDTQYYGPKIHRF
jgi:transmembrane protein 231